MASADGGEELTCSVCLSIYKGPVTLSCGHTFCQDCITKTWQGKENGDYYCPGCRQRFEDRPQLKKNITLCNIMERFLSTWPEKDQPETKKCPIHKEDLKYYCGQDKVCVCVSCCVFGEHKGHQVELLHIACDNMRKELGDMSAKLNLKRQDTEKRIQNLEASRKKVEKQANNITGRVDAMFDNIRNQLDALEKKFKMEVALQENQLSQSVSSQLKKLELMKEDISRRVKSMEELQNMTDPISFLQGWASCQQNLEDVKDPPPTGDLDEVLVLLNLQRLLPGFVSGLQAKKMFYLQQIMDIRLDINTAGVYVDVSPDLKTATALDHECRAVSPRRFLYSQVLSTCSFSSGQHYWEVATSAVGRWRVGIAYNSIDRRGDHYLLGNNSKSWCIDMYQNIHIMIHTHQLTNVFPSTPNPSLGIFLDYKAGRLSFYQLGHPVRHLHTFTAKFTEPVYAAFGVYDQHASITILKDH